MKIFDYKFIILILLSIIVFYIYTEIQNLKNKINKQKEQFELKILNLNKILAFKNKSKMNIDNQPKPVLMNIKPVNVAENNNNQQIVCELPLNNTPTEIIELPNSSCQLDDDSSTDFEDDSETDNESENDILSINSDDIVVYSNESENKNFENNTNDESIQNFEQDKINLDIDNQSDIEKKIIKLKSNEMESYKNSSYSTLNDNLQLDINIEEIVNNVSVEPQYQIKKLQRKKIDELRKLASELEISINKVVNGKLKNKTKKELCNEIIENQST